MNILDFDTHVEANQVIRHVIIKRSESGYGFTLSRLVGHHQPNDSLPAKNTATANLAKKYQEKQMDKVNQYFVVSYVCKDQFKWIRFLKFLIHFIFIYF
jgi:hypothetical protein